MPRPLPATLARYLARIDVPAWQADRTARPERVIREVFTGRDLARVPVADATDVAEAFERARRAQVEWARRPAAERAAVLTRFADLVHEHREELLDVCQAESGKVRAHALEEVLDVMLVARYYAKHGPAWLGPERVPGVFPVATRARVTHTPRGVVGVIAPWNYPLSLSVSDGLPALLAGNAVVVKPDSQTPLTALAGALLLEEAGMPRDLWQVVTGPGSVVGTAIVEHCDYLMFTGSTATGRTLGAQVGARLVHWSAELGGKNAMIVGPGVDVDKAVEVAVRACFANAGQLCISMERIYVVGEGYEPFLEAFSRRVAGMRLGGGYGFEPEMGSLISEDQLAKVSEHIADAVSRGARIVAGGRARPDLGPLFHEPTVLVDVPDDAVASRTETFGPVVSVYRAPTLDDAVDAANDTDYGLNTAIYCADDRQGADVAERVHTGMVNVNEAYGVAWASVAGPSGGWGASGVGVRHGREGMLKYTRTRTIATQSRLLNLAGPTFVRVPARVWSPILARATHLMKYLPGR